MAKVCRRRILRSATQARVAIPRSGDCPVSARRPFPNITSSLGFLGSQWNGYSSYNAGNVKLERRSSSIALVAVYTWAKSLDDKSAAAGVGSTNAFAGHMNEHNQALDYGRSDFDVNHRFVTSVVYQLPLGRGKRFGGNMNRAADLAIGGWQVTGITTFQKGFPYSILANDNFGLLTTFTQRANLVPGLQPQQRISTRASTSTSTLHASPSRSQASSATAAATSCAGRESTTGTWASARTSDFTERVAFQFRAEAFNVFNHAQYGYDPNTATSIGAPIDNNPNDTAYGKVLAARPGRIIQLGGKLIF